MQFEFDYAPAAVGVMGFAAYRLLTVSFKSRANNAGDAPDQMQRGTVGTPSLEEPAEKDAIEAKINATMEEPVGVNEPMDEPEPEEEEEEEQRDTHTHTGHLLQSSLQATATPAKSSSSQLRSVSGLLIVGLTLFLFSVSYEASVSQTKGAIGAAVEVGLSGADNSFGAVEVVFSQPQVESPMVVEVEVESPMVVEVEAAPAEVPVKKQQHFLTMDLTRQQMETKQQGDTIYYKSAYWGWIRAGTPPQWFKVVFDTGSGHVILPSGYCHSETCKVHSRFRRSASKSAKDIDHDGSEVIPGQPRDQITVSFGTGEVDGVFIEDKVCLGKEGSAVGINSSNVPAVVDGEVTEPECMNMRIIAATAMSEEPFKGFHFDGVLGLGLSALSQTPEFNFAAVMAKSLGADIASETPNMFSVFLGDTPEEQSQITFGGYNEDRVDGALSWAPVHDPEAGHWMVRIKSLRVDGQLVDFCKEGCKAAVDTGTSLLAVPTPAFPELFSLLRHPVPESGFCSGPGPQLRFELDTPDNFEVVLGPEDYSQSEATLPGRKVKPLFPVANATEAETIYCKPLLMAMDLAEPIGPKLFILGEPALRRYYTVYDGEEKRIGFGYAKHGAPTEMF